MPYISPQAFASQAATPLVPQEDITNPFKRASAQQVQNTNNSMMQNQFMQTVNPQVDYNTRPHAYSQQFSQSVNLEAPPENSEQPDFLTNSNAAKPFGVVSNDFILLIWGRFIFKVIEKRQAAKPKLIFQVNKLIHEFY